MDIPPVTTVLIPIFTSQLEKSRDATDEANIRSAIAEVTASVLADGKEKTIEVTATGKKAGWSGEKDASTAIKIGGINVNPSTTGWTVKGTVTSSDKDAEVTVNAK